MSQQEEAFINAFTQIFEQNPKFNTQIQRIYTDGDYVIVHSFAPFGETGNAIVDIYRVNDNGKSQNIGMFFNKYH